MSHRDRVSVYIAKVVTEFMKAKRRWGVEVYAQTNTRLEKLLL